MKSIESKPTEAEKGNCEKHGEFTFEYIQYSPRGKTWVKDYCGNCLEEKQAETKLEEERKRAADDIEFERKRRERSRVNAGISKRNMYKTFNDYICVNEGQEKAKADCERFVKNFPTDKSMIMVGGVGTGKTLLASAMIDSLVDNYK